MSALDHTVVEEKRPQGWAFIQRRMLATRATTRNFATGAAFVARITEIAEELNHHPDLVLRYPYVEIRSTSHDTGGVTDRDITLTSRITEAAAEAGIALDPAAVVLGEVALDVHSQADVEAFWSVVLTGSDEHVDRDAIAAPDPGMPIVWFQPTDRPDGTDERQHFHVDVHVHASIAQARISQAVAAGGTIVDDSHADLFTVLADPEGNKVCICPHP